MHLDTGKHTYYTRYMSLLNEAPTTVTNPFSDLRAQTGLSHVDLGKRMGVSKQALIRLEQGTFDLPLPNVLQYWVDQGYSELALVDQYEDFQAFTRQSNRQLFGPTLLVNISYQQHPFEQLRLGISTPVGALNKTQVAKRLCLPQSTLQRWETDWRRQKSIPRNLQIVLMQTGYTKDQVKYFSHAYKTWRELQLALRGGSFG